MKALNTARSARKKKLKEADDLLAGLDGFVLDALSLTLPPLDGRMIYGIRQKEISRKRLDVSFYQPWLRKTEAAIRSLPCQTVGLGKLLREPPVNGVDARDFQENGRRYLRVQNVRPFELSLEDVKYVSTESEKQIGLSEGDILVTRKGTYGIAAIVPPDAVDCLISSEVILLRIKPNSSVLTDFLVAWINTSACQTLLFRHKSGGIMGHLTQDVIVSVPVPTADRLIQQAIVDEVARRREKARQLRADAEKLWDEAKR